MPLFLGYDPGGYSKGPRNGVAAAEIKRDGSFKFEPKTKTFHYASEVRDWLQEHSSSKALGIDTLMAWSLQGRRACDDALRKSYQEHRNTVIVQNSLGSSMTINGILVAQAGRELKLPLVESHPKLLRKAGLLPNDLVKFLNDKSDDEADALIAAWCASRWFFKRWKTDLFQKFPESLHFPAGDAFYPWPEMVFVRR